MDRVHEIIANLERFADVAQDIRNSARREEELDGCNIWDYWTGATMMAQTIYLTVKDGREGIEIERLRGGADPLSTRPAASPLVNCGRVVELMDEETLNLRRFMCDMAARLRENASPATVAAVCGLLEARGRFRKETEDYLLREGGDDAPTTAP